MLYFALAILAYCIIVHKFFDHSVRPIGKKLGHDFIPFPKQAVKAWILVATALYSTSSFMAARKSDWQLDESLGALSVIMGIMLGLTVRIEE